MSVVTLVVDVMGTHPHNRSSYGINEESVHLLGADIVDLGWEFSSLGTVESRIAIEDCPVTRFIEKHNIELTRNSEMLAKVEPMTIKYGCLTNNHTVLLLRALKAGVASTVENLSVDGKMSLAQVGQRDPAFLKACEEGWSWTVLHHSVHALYGKPLMEFLMIHGKRAKLKSS